MTAEIDVPKMRSEDGDDERHSRSPTCQRAIRSFFPTLWPGPRSLGATDIFIGVNAVDYSGYPDCRPEFIRAFEQLANLATRAGVEGARFKIHAPLLALTKAEIIRRGLSLGVDYSLTHSCYDPTPEVWPAGMRFVPAALERFSRSRAERPDWLRTMNLRQNSGCLFSHDRSNGRLPSSSWP